MSALRSELGEKVELLGHYRDQLDSQAATLAAQHEHQTSQLLQQLDTLNNELQHTKTVCASFSPKGCQQLNNSLFFLLCYYEKPSTIWYLVYSDISTTKYQTCIWPSCEQNQNWLCILACNW